jgi:methyl-accepting chemotaxis protein
MLFALCAVLFRELTSYPMIDRILHNTKETRNAMPDADNSLTLEGLARILRDHAADAASQFAQLREQDARFQARMDELHREIAAVASMVRDLADVSVRQMDEVAEHRHELEEHRQHIRQIFARMEESDARFEAVNLEIRDMRTDIQRILNAIERRGGNGGSRPEAPQP